MRNKYFLALIFLFIGSGIAAQNAPKPDIELLLSMPNAEASLPHRHIEFGITKSDSTNMSKYNPLNVALGAAMFVYQKVFSPQISANCLYHPSCSEFGKNLFKEYGLVKGTFATADRLMRCNRFSTVDFRNADIDPSDHKVHEQVDIYKSKKK